MGTPHERIGVSRGAVDRAGEHLRDWFMDSLLVGPAEHEASVVVNQYRTEFKRPLRSVVMGLRSAVRTAGAEVIVTERLKRQPRIIGKLERFPWMDLTRMQDIAGCRAILGDLDAVAAVHQRVTRQRSEVVKTKRPQRHFRR